MCCLHVLKMEVSLDGRFLGESCKTKFSNSLNEERLLVLLALTLQL